MENVNSDFICLWWGNLDLLDLEFFASSPADGCFALDRLSCSVRHGDGGRWMRVNTACERGNETLWLYNISLEALQVSRRENGCPWLYAREQFAILGRVVILPSP